MIAPTNPTITSTNIGSFFKRFTFCRSQTISMDHYHDIPCIA